MAGSITPAAATGDVVAVVSVLAVSIRARASRTSHAPIKAIGRTDAARVALAHARSHPHDRDRAWPIDRECPPSVSVRRSVAMAEQIEISTHVRLHAVREIP